jgi:hypothetical protein
MKFRQQQNKRGNSRTRSSQNTYNHGIPQITVGSNNTLHKEKTYQPDHTRNLALCPTKAPSGMAVPRNNTSVYSIPLPTNPATLQLITNINSTERPSMRLDPEGVVHLGRDGVLRSLNADRTQVLDYRRLSPEELTQFAAPFDQATRDALVGVDGRNVTDVVGLWAVPAEVELQGQGEVETEVQTTAAVTQHPPWRRDPEGVVHLGRDGVLRSLNANRTVVLDYRRLSPEELTEFAAPSDQATRDALVGVDGRDVLDEKVLWAVPASARLVNDTASC